MSDITKARITNLNLWGKIIPCIAEVSVKEYLDPNFQAYEVMDPTTRELYYNPLTHIVIQTFRKETGWVVIVESFHRGDTYNKAVGGEDDSNHKTGSAIDFKAFAGKKQIDPLHVAYALKSIAERFNIGYGLGTYMKGYIEGSLGFNHFDVRDGRSLWVCYKKPTLVSISDLTDIQI